MRFNQRLERGGIHKQRLAGGRFEHQLGDQADQRRRPQHRRLPSRTLSGGDNLIGQEPHKQRRIQTAQTAITADRRTPHTDGDGCSQHQSAQSDSECPRMLSFAGRPQHDKHQQVPEQVFGTEMRDVPAQQSPPLAAGNRSKIQLQQSGHSRAQPSDDRQAGNQNRNRKATHPSYSSRQPRSHHPTTSPIHQPRGP
nr:hypothetical protein [Roseimaritima sediminicola]